MLIEQLEKAQLRPAHLLVHRWLLHSRFRQSFGTCQPPAACIWFGIAQDLAETLRHTQAPSRKSTWRVTQQVPFADRSDNRTFLRASRNQVARGGQQQDAISCKVHTAKHKMAEPKQGSYAAWLSVMALAWPFWAGIGLKLGVQAIFM